MDNIDTMAYTGQEPWHGLGTKVPSIMTSEEALKAAKLNWTVEKQPIFIRNGMEVPNKFANVRYNGDPTKPISVLGVVGNSYRVLQNKEAFSFMDTLVGEKAAMYETVGSLGRGETVWMLVKLPKSIEVVHNDVVNQYLLLSNSHDGRLPVSVRFTPIRVVCQNTLIAAFGQSSYIVNVRHTVNMGKKVEEARRILGISNKFYQEFAQMSRRLATVSMTKKMLDSFVDKIGLAEIKGEEESTRAKNIRGEVIKSIESGLGNTKMKVSGTLWAAVNGVAEYVDHHRTTRTKDDDELLVAAKRLKSQWFGSGADLKELAWKSAMELAR